jgi:fructosamine-3-kinase
MTVPAPVLKAVEEALEERKGRPPVLRPSAPVGGGCINPSARLETKSGEAFFLKWNPSAPSDMFAAEADGLEALRKGAHGTAAVPAPWAASGADSRALHVPEVLGMGGTGTVSDPGWLLLEWIPQGSPASDYGLDPGKGPGRPPCLGSRLSTRVG